MTGQLTWLKGGIALAAAFLAAVIFVKPIGVSTQFVIFDALIWDFLSVDLIVESDINKSGYESSNAYLNKSGGAYAKNVANPLNYGLVFVLSMALGAFISSKTKGPQTSSADKVSPRAWRTRFGESSTLRYVAAFLGGALVLFGARLAGGCTSGHMMSGMMQTSVSGYLFAMAAFATGIPVAIYLYRNQEGGI